MTTFFARLAGYKTVSVNALVLVMGLLQAFGIAEVVPDPTLAGDAFDQVIGGGASILGGINLALRYFTSTAIFRGD